MLRCVPGSKISVVLRNRGHNCTEPYFKRCVVSLTGQATRLGR
jgi:hypothetical protein